MKYSLPPFEKFLVSLEEEINTFSWKGGQSALLANFWVSWSDKAPAARNPGEKRPGSGRLDFIHREIAGT